MNPSAIRDPYRADLARGAAVAVAAGWTAFIAAFFVAPDQHELRLVFNWLVLLPVTAGLPWIVRELRLPSLATGAILASVTWMCLSSTWGASAGVAFSAHHATNVALAASLVLATAAVELHVPWLLRNLDALVAALGSAVALASLVAHFATSTHIATPHIPVRLTGLGILRNELVLASVLGISFLLATARYYRSNSAATATAWLVACVPLLVAMLGTLSRGPVLALLVALPLVVLPSRAHASRHFAPLACLAIAAGLSALMPEFVDNVGLRGFDPSHRDRIWRTVIAESPSDWLIGQGLRAERRVDIGGMAFPHEHSHLLSVFRFAGVTGVVLFSLAFLALVREAARLPISERSVFLPWLVYGFGCQLTNGTFPLSRPAYEWLLFWVPAACCLALRQPRSHST